jgi:hypothetical protein
MPESETIIPHTAVVLAHLWRESHHEHVDRLVATEAASYPPTDPEDVRRPELWKAAHWRWLLRMEDAA